MAAEAKVTFMGGNTLPMVRSPQYREIYAANLRLRVSVIDATITFMNLVEQVGGGPGMQEEVSVTMPFSALKVLTEHLKMVVETIEQEFGPIRVPIANRPNDQHKETLIKALQAMPLAQ
jgi:hypothetical protein